MTLRVVFFGNSDSTFSNRHYAALAAAPCQIVGVVDVPPARRISTNTRAVGAGPSFAAQAAACGVQAFEPASPNTLEFVESIRRLAPDLFIAAGYMSLLKPDILGVPSLLAANFHASLLPAYRGKHPVFWALRNGERRTGLTVHIMDPHFDTGEILYQVRVRTRRRDTVSSLYDRIMEQSVPLVRRLIEDAQAERHTSRPQPVEGASYYSSPKDEDFRLDWRREAEELRRWIHVSPGRCFAEIRGGCVYFVDAKVRRGRGSSGPGTVLFVGSKVAEIEAGKDALRVARVKTSDGAERDCADLFREMGIKVGTILSTAAA
ncbi:MAG: methionyl-tRNA formyltransferase [Rudaea sp.]